MQHMTVFTAVFIARLMSSFQKKDKKGVPGSECAEWTWGLCTPSSKDYGVSFHEGTYGTQTRRTGGRVPSKWKKEFGAHKGKGKD
uniref:Midkine n=1 Tax=Sciurus vulgaris TaxID=55149 RepID=A0A8D2DMZ7_SCIVU